MHSDGRTCLRCVPTDPKLNFLPREAKKLEHFMTSAEIAHEYKSGWICQEELTRRWLPRKGVIYHAAHLVYRPSRIKFYLPREFQLLVSVAWSVVDWARSSSGRDHRRCRGSDPSRPSATGEFQRLRSSRILCRFRSNRPTVRLWKLINNWNWI